MLSRAAKQDQMEKFTWIQERETLPNQTEEAVMRVTEGRDHGS